MLDELHDVLLATTEEPFDVGRGAVAEPDPDDLRGRALQHAQTLKILVFRHEDEPVGGGVSPDRSITSCGQASLQDVT
jgi:hypothetical protein